MKKLFGLFILLIAISLTLNSCEKENNNVDPDEPDTGNVVPEWEPCTHSNLEHIEAVPRTDTTPGNIEYYRCVDCNRYFLDASATREVKLVYLPAKNHEINKEILDKIRDIFPFDTSSQRTKVEGKKIVSDLFSFVSSCRYNLKEKKCIAEIEQSLNQIENSLNEIDEKVTKIQEQNQKILNLIENADYQKKVDNLFKTEKFIYENSKTYFGYVKKEYENYVTVKSDTAGFQQVIKDIGLGWSQLEYLNTDIYTLVTNMMADFNCTAVAGQKMNYPQIFHKYVDSYRPWEHEGYTDRQQMDLETEAVLSIGYFMACLYRENSKDYPYAPARKDDSVALSRQFQKIDSTVIADINNMKAAYKAYRRFNDGCKEYILNSSAKIVFSDCLDGQLEPDDKNSDHYVNLQCMNQTIFSQGIDHVQKIWDDVAGGTGYRQGTCLRVPDYSYLRNANSGGNIYAILAHTAKIINMPDGTMGNNYQILYDDMTKWESKPHTFNTKLKWAKTWFNQWYVYTTGYEDGDNPPYCSVIYGTEMKEDCTPYGYFSYTGWYSVHKPFHKDSDCVLLERNDYSPRGANIVYISKYTGTIYDE